MKCNCYYDINGAYYCSKLLSKPKEDFTQTDMQTTDMMQQSSSMQTADMMHQSGNMHMHMPNEESVYVTGNSEPVIEYPSPVNVKSSINNTFSSSDMPSPEILRQQLISLIQSGQLTQDDLRHVMSLTASN